MERTESEFRKLLDEARFSLNSVIPLKASRSRRRLSVPGKVIRVYRKPRAKWAIRAVVGAGIGAVVGVILTSTAGERSRNEGQDVPSRTCIVGGAGIGAGIGGPDLRGLSDPIPAFCSSVKKVA